MQKLFVDFVPRDKCVIDGEQARHIAKSLRMKTGDMLTLCDGNGGDYGCIIENITQTTVELKVCYRQAESSEPSVYIHLFQGVTKGDKFEEIVQKCTELGISEITPVLTCRCISRPDGKAAEKKKRRYEKIALEAAQQSGRGKIPVINEMVNLKTALENDKSHRKILFYEGGGKSLGSLVSPEADSYSLYIGPEGGFEEAEVELLKNGGGEIATLGKRILRTQTAPIAALTAIMLLTGNLE